MKEVEILPSSVFVAHGCVQHGGWEWRGGHRVRHYTYLISVSREQSDATAFAHGEGIHIGSRADELSVKTVGGSAEADVDVEDSENESSENNNVKNLELSNLDLKTESIPEEEGKQS